MEDEKAGFWLRVAALTADEILLVTGVGVFLFLLHSLTGFDVVRQVVWAIIIYEFVDYNYYTLFWLLRGQTPGKMLMRTRLVKADGSAITYRDVFIRYWTWMLGVALLRIGYFWIAFNKNKQGWNDLTVGTYVIKTK